MSGAADRTGEGAAAPIEMAVFGGTFDPPHVGHVLAAAWALSASRVTRVLVVPSFEHPLGKRPDASYAHRVRMAELAIAPLRGVEVSRIEERLGGESRTLRTLEALHADMPDIALRLLVGADILIEAPRWHRWERVCELAPPLVVGRTGYPLPAACRLVLPEVSSTELRQALARGEPTRGLLPVAVADYARDHGLYRSEPA